MWEIKWLANSYYILTYCESRSSYTKTAAAAKLLQSCLTLCDPRDSRPRGSPISGILQAKNTRVGCHCLLQCMKVKSESESEVTHTKSTANSDHIRNSSFILSFLLSMSIKINFQGWWTSKFIFKSSEPSIIMTHSRFSNYIGQFIFQTTPNIGEFRPFLFSR